MRGHIERPSQWVAHHYRRMIGWTPTDAQASGVLEMVGARTREQRPALSTEPYFHASHRTPQRLHFYQGVAA